MHEIPADTWSRGRLQLRIPDGRYIEIAPRAAEHPLFGVCDAVLVDGAVKARFQAVDWQQPAFIPPLDQPGALPEGAGTAILNRLAMAAPGPLRYRGPYPTGALFDALLECFRVDDPPAAFALFTRDVEQAALLGSMHEVAVDFVPAPFRRVWADCGVCVQLRDGVEKIHVHGRGYSRHAAGCRRVRQEDQAWVAAVVLGGREWAEIARVSPDGTVLDGPRPLPPAPAAMLGQPLPGGVRAALLAALPERAPALLQPVMRQVLGSVPLVWDDTGDEASVIKHGGEHLAIHAGLLALFADAPALELLEAIARAVEPAAQRLAQQRLHRMFE